MIAPCKNCENRGCGKEHDRCEKYQAYKKELSEAYEIRKMNVLLGYKGKKRYETPEHSPFRTYRR